jgi:PAS domain S-box-containing protein
MAETISIDDARLDRISDQIVSYAKGNFNTQMELSGNGDVLDSIILGLNVLGEELKSHLDKILMREQQLKEALFRLNEAQHVARIGSWEWDLLKDKIEWADELYNLYGISKKDFDGCFESYMKFAHPEDRDLVYEAVKKAREDKKPFSFYHRIIDSEGEIRHHYSRGEVFTNDKGIAVKMMGTEQDVTEMREAEIKLSRMAAIVESNSDAIISKTLDGIIQSWNPQAEKIFGYTKEEVIGKHISILFPENRLAEEDKIVNSIKNGKPLINYETERKRKDGSLFPVAITVSPILDDQGKILGISKIARDITERKKAEEQLKKYTRELEYRSQEAHEFSYIASHDLQEPLRTITNYIGLLAKDYHGKLDKNADIYLNFIKNAAERMKDLISDLLEYNKIEKDQMVLDVDLNEIVKNILDDMSLQITETNATVNIEKLPIIKGFPTRLSSLFQNLINNAIKFRKPGVDPVVNIKGREKGKDWLFEISDNGIGIEKVYYSKIFKLFQRLHTRKEYQGTGIGLAHCKKIVELRGGKLWVESEPGVGSTFYFTLPKVINA